MFYGINSIATFIAGTIFIILLPGPNSLYVMSVATRKGVAAGYRGASGVFAGDTILMLLSATGAASLLQANPALFMVIKYAGALYLAWMGVGLLRSAFVIWRGKGAAGSENDQPVVDNSRPFHTALLISLMNPKAILFYMAFFPLFIDPVRQQGLLTYAFMATTISPGPGTIAGAAGASRLYRRTPENFVLASMFTGY